MDFVSASTVLDYSYLRASRVLDYFKAVRVLDYFRALFDYLRALGDALSVLGSRVFRGFLGLRVKRPRASAASFEGTGPFCNHSKPNKHPVRNYTKAKKPTRNPKPLNP